MENLQTHQDAIMLATLLTETIYKVDEWGAEKVLFSGNQEVVSVLQEGSADALPTASLNSSGAFDYLGENNKYILVLVKYPNSKHIPDKDKEFLLKIIGALKLGLEDVAILNYAHFASADLQMLKDYFSCNKIIAFDLAPTAPIFKNLNIQDFATTAFNGVSIMRTPDSLAIIEADKNKKMVLWNALKLLFNVK
ncbi:hypothetical protein [Solitalea lacus]|uniref:hypothetical protein n=1 Tax=Solitalea lacus TaxID=2911172 RepID=UPI001EDA5750|nr:hypothetical protein [Solitalea lacus]UKJ07299.1 hypothetical protein L2B55_17460 [Solitalea lacus]